MYIIRCYCQILIKPGFARHTSTLDKNAQMPNFMKIRPVGAELVHADGRPDGHNEAKSHFSQFWRKRLKTEGFGPVKQPADTERRYDVGSSQ